MKQIYLLLVLMFSANNMFTQSYYTNIPGTDTLKKETMAKVLQTRAGTVILATLEAMPAADGTVFHIKITRRPLSGTVTQQLVVTTGEPDDVRGVPFITLTETVTGRIILLVRALEVQKCISDNDGASWSTPVFFNGAERPGYFFGGSENMLLVPDSTGINLTVPRIDGFFTIRSTDNGETWFNYKSFSSFNQYLMGGFITYQDSTNIYIAYISTLNSVYFLKTAVYTKATGALALREGFNVGQKCYGFSIYNNSAGGGVFWSQTDLKTGKMDVYKSVINPLTHRWSLPEKVTSYENDDLFKGISNTLNAGYVAFYSKRGKYGNGIFFGEGKSSIEKPVPELAKNFTLTAVNIGNTFTLFPNIELSEREFSRKLVYYTVNKGPEKVSELFDNGMLNDSLPDDGRYGAIIPGVQRYDSVKYRIEIIAADGREYKTTVKVFVPALVTSVSDTLSGRGLGVIFNSTGKIEDNPNVSGRIINHSAVSFSGIAWSRRFMRLYWYSGSNYSAGPLSGDPEDQRNSIYTIKSSDAPFSESWQLYRYAVARGADFYDGDLDGKYNPADKNGNGKWDANEDRPMNIGDIFTWCVFNDDNNYSSFGSPTGMEIQRSTVAFTSDNPQIQNNVLIRYRLINRGLIAPVFDSLRFGIYTDFDLGNYSDDLVGCDTLRRMQYGYQTTPDAVLGKAPALGVRFLRLPYSYQPGVTYTDNNGNGLFDEGTDTPLQSTINEYAYPKSTIAGAARITSAVYSGNEQMQMHADMLNYEESAYEYMKGGYGADKKIDPCIWVHGNGASLPNCSTINPAYLYSGDPVTGTGWLNTNPHDQSIFSITGPFRMEKNKPVDVWMMYSVTETPTTQHPVTMLRNMTDTMYAAFNNGFTGLTSAVLPVTPPSEYKLFQNYPNPFNAATTIQFYIPVYGRVSLKLYDVLGKEVMVVTDKEYSAGAHEAEIRNDKLSSGIYFYTLRAGNFIQTKKLLLLK